MKRIVHMLNFMGMGGIENFLMNVYRTIDKTKYQFDFILQSDEKSYFEDEINSFGGKIYKIPRIEKHPIKHIQSLKKILKENDYIAFHRHTASSVTFVDLIVAHKAGIKQCISHDKKMLNKICRPLIRKFSTRRLACGVDAGEWLYGNADFDVVNNRSGCRKI